jgi:hypothetical protein
VCLKLFLRLCHLSRSLPKLLQQSGRKQTEEIQKSEQNLSALQLCLRG